MRDTLKKTPFYDKEKNTFKFPLRPLRDLVMIYEVKKAKNYAGTSIVIPENYREDHRQAKGVVVGAGKGYTNKKGKFKSNPISVGDFVIFDRTVPWERLDVEDAEGNTHLIRLMGAEDVYGFVDA